jgi:2,4-dienoyl-CoA reductase-like NADH-dependent reductase (Old Yellow Enzyme family)
MLPPAPYGVIADGRNWTCHVGANRMLLTDSLFRPLQVGDLTLANRIVMSPMTRELSPGGVLGAGAEDYYARRAAGGAGLVITEGTSVDHPVSHHTANVPHMYGEAALARWKAVTGKVHQAGGRIFPQLWHTGLARVTAETHNPEELSIAPSVVGKKPMRAMTENDIADVIHAFAAAAASAQAAGFDGVAIHGAHGYLFDQFFWKVTNRRTDAYGIQQGRTRFAVEVLKAVRAQVGPAFPIMFRFSQWKGSDYDARIAETPEQLGEILMPLAQAGVDIFDASTRRFWLPEFGGSPLNLAGWAKKLTGKLAMTVGSVGLEGPLDANRMNVLTATRVSQDNLRVLMEMLDRGDFDLVGVGRILLANPDWPKLVRAGRFEYVRPFSPERLANMEPALE